ncbi:MAG: small acid-soluble spore protein SspI [Bacilli bacterium]|nr:small acid-soluble spore protein SspI [Bacilli bacterium]
MDIDIRKHIINNFKDDSIEAIKEAIEAGISSQDEIALPGLGVFLEMIWNHSDDEEKNNLLNKIKMSL